MALPNFERFNVSSDNNSVGLRWDKYVSKLENLFVGMNIDSKKRRKALLLHYAGDEVYDIYETLPENLESSDSNFDETKAALKLHFSPQKNTEYEKFEFRTLKQHHGESIDQFTTRLRQKATYCAFTNKDDEVKSQFIQGVFSNKLRIKCLESSDKSLSDLLVIARTMDLAKTQADNMSRDQHKIPEQVDKLRRRPQAAFKPAQPQNKSQNAARQPAQHRRTSSCRNCGGNYPHQNGRCPAFGSKCNVLRTL